MTSWELFVLKGCLSAPGEAPLTYTGGQDFPLKNILATLMIKRAPLACSEAKLT